MLNIFLDSDILTIFAEKFNQHTYLGTPFDMVHDWTFGALKTIAVQENMPHVLNCV